jgi:hypothetical protein
MITEQEFLNAIKIINEYKVQIDKITNEAIIKAGLKQK